MDYDEVNNCMTEQQKNSLKTAALQQLLQKVLGGAQEYTSYDDVNNQLTEQQKNSYQTAALQQLAEADIGGGTIVPLADYVDISTFTITDKDGLIEAINDGKGFYVNGNVLPTGEVSDVLFSGAINNDKIILTSNLTYALLGGTDYSLEQMTLNFDKNTGTLDPSDPAFQTEFVFPHVDTSTPMFKLLTLGELTINIGSSTYTYNGTQDVSITIADGENTEF